MRVCVCVCVCVCVYVCVHYVVAAIGVSARVWKGSLACVHMCLHRSTNLPQQ